MSIRLIIIGHAEHGKDTVADFIADTYNLKNGNASRLACEAFIFPLLSNFYFSAEDCYNDRSNNRELWFKLIQHYCTHRKTELAHLVFSKADIYAGIRDINELLATKQELKPIVIWVDATKRLPLEPTTSISVTEYNADYIIDNNGTIDDLAVNIITIMDNINEQSN